MVVDSSLWQWTRSLLLSGRGSFSQRLLLFSSGSFSQWLLLSRMAMTADDSSTMTFTVGCSNSLQMGLHPRTTCGPLLRVLQHTSPPGWFPPSDAVSCKWCCIEEFLLALSYHYSWGNTNEDIHYIKKQSNVTKINSVGKIRCHSCLRLQEPIY